MLPKSQLHCYTGNIDLDLNLRQVCEYLYGIVFTNYMRRVFTKHINDAIQIRFDTTDIVLNNEYNNTICTLLYIVRIFRFP